MAEHLHRLFYPRAVAIVGASRDPSKIGHVVLKNILSWGYPGRVYPVNPNADEILGLRAYPRVSSIPGQVDVVIVAVPAQRVLDVVEDAGSSGAEYLVVLSSGFKEVGRADLERALVERAREYGMRVLGPNIFGYVYTPARLNASFGPSNVLPGGVAFISQSGALGIALIGYSIVEGVGVSGIVSMGNKADIDDADVLEFFREDPNTKVVIAYVEGVADGRRFLETASSVSLRKPLVVIKAGRTEAGAKAAASHTGSLSSGPLLWEGVLKQAGALQARDIETAFDYVKLFSAYSVPPGPNILVITNGGGAGVQAADTLAENGVYLGEPPADYVSYLREFLPEFASTRNPVDITGGAPDEFYYLALRKALEHPEIHAVLVLYCQTMTTNPLRTAEAVVRAVEEVGSGKPVVAGFVGSEEVQRAINHLLGRGVPAYPTPERAAQALAALYRYAALRRVVERRVEYLQAARGEKARLGCAESVVRRSSRGLP
uniref:Acetyl CoA synthetase n=1 Tax=Thermofilum pendens TaxID=2269 RepID=A0A7C3SNW0_THEPE